MNIPAPVLPAARLTLRRFSGHNSFHKTSTGLILVGMRRGLKGAVTKTNSMQSKQYRWQNRLPLKAVLEGQWPSVAILHLERRLLPFKTGSITKRSP